MSCSLLSGLNLGLLGDEDAIEELALVLAADLADLLDLRAGLGEQSVVDAIEDDLTLDVSGLSANSATSHLDDLVLLATKEPDADADERSISLLGSLLHLLELTSNVRVVLGDLASLARDNNFPCIHSALNIVWNLNPVLSQHRLHF